MSIESLEQELKDLKLKIEPLQILIDKRRRQLCKEKSKLFILENAITKDNVHHCDDDELPLFGHIDPFGKWLDKHAVHPWCVWNGIIYKTLDIIEGRMRSSEAFYDDI